LAIRCIGFDLGGVLLRINQYWADALHQAGFPALERGHLVDYDGTNLLGEAKISEEEYFEGLRKYLGLETPEDAIATHDAILIGEYAGVANTIADIQAKGYRVGCLSNTNFRHRDQCLARFPVCKSFDRFVTSCEEGLNKPDAKLYARFMEIMGVGPDELLYFDDWAPNIEGAQKCGIRAFRIDPTEETDPQIRAVLRQFRVLT
jgi:glucose-1-phosphatase